MDLDDLIANRLLNTLFDLVDAGEIDETSSTYDYWLDRVRNGNSGDVA